MVNGRYVIYSCHSYIISHVIVIICVISCFLFISYGSEIYFIPLLLIPCVQSIDGMKERGNAIKDNKCNSSTGAVCLTNVSSL